MIGLHFLVSLLTVITYFIFVTLYVHNLTDYERDIAKANIRKRKKKNLFVAMLPCFVPVMNIMMIWYVVFKIDNLVAAMDLIFLHGKSDEQAIDESFKEDDK